MPYEEPTYSDLVVRFPEFGAVNEKLIALVLEESVAAVGESWCEKDRKLAQILLAAHTLSMEGEPQRSLSVASGKVSPNAQSGAIVEMKDRDVSVKFSDKQMNSEHSSYGDLSREFMKTTYGTRFFDLMRRNFAGPLVV